MRIGPVQLRALTPGDMPQLLRLYAASRDRELHLLPLTPAQKEHFVQMQCHAQHAHYRHHFAGADFQLVECDGALAGRLYWQLDARELRLLEITLLPQYRGRGIARLLIEHLKSLAAARGVAMSLQVECTNPAQALYRKLGFSVLSSDPMFVHMRLEPPAEPSLAAGSETSLPT